MLQNKPQLIETNLYHHSPDALPNMYDPEQFERSLGQVALHQERAHSDQPDSEIEGNVGTLPAYMDDADPLYADETPLFEGWKNNTIDGAYRDQIDAQAHEVATNKLSDVTNLHTPVNIDMSILSPTFGQVLPPAEPPMHRHTHLQEQYGRLRHSA